MIRLLLDLDWTFYPFLNITQITFFLMIWYSTLQFHPRLSNQIQNHWMNEFRFWQNTFQSFDTMHNHGVMLFWVRPWKGSRIMFWIEIPFCISNSRIEFIVQFTKNWIITRRINLAHTRKQREKKNRKNGNIPVNFQLNPEPGDYDYVYYIQHILRSIFIISHWASLSYGVSAWSGWVGHIRNRNSTKNLFFLSSLLLVLLLLLFILG